MIRARDDNTLANLARAGKTERPAAREGVGVGTLNRQLIRAYVREQTATHR